MWDAGEGRSLAHVSLPAPMWVPPAPAAPPVSATPAGPSGVLPHCAQLHRRLQVHWELFGEQVRDRRIYLCFRRYLLTIQ